MPAWRESGPDRSGIVSPGFILVRAPLLSIDSFWGLADEVTRASAEDAGGAACADEDRCGSVTRQWLRELLARPEVVEAIGLSSSQLAERAALWLQEDLEPGSTDSKLEATLLKYLIRMSCRPTPFGLFGSVTHGIVGPSTRLELGDRAAWRRRSRLDVSVLDAAARHLLSEATARRSLTYRVNQTLFRDSTDSVRFVTSADGPDGKSFDLVRADLSPPLSYVIEAGGAELGVEWQELLEGLCERFPSLPHVDVAAFIDELVEWQILVPQFGPTLTGDAAPHVGLTDSQSKVVHETLGSAIRLCLERLSEMDSRGFGLARSDYALALKPLAPYAAADPAHAVQVDFVRQPVEDPVVGAGVVREVQATIGVLSQIQESEPSHIEAFAAAFLERFGDSEVPLLEAIDEERGVGFGPPSGAKRGPLHMFQGIDLSRKERVARDWGDRDDRLLDLLLLSVLDGRHELQLTSDVISKLRVPESLPVPDALCAVVTLFRQPDECDREPSILFRAAVGPPADRMLARFAHLDGALADSLGRLKAIEASLHPEAIVAEIVHLPSGRAGNVVVRPVTFRHHIGVLGRGGSEQNELPLQDLAISVQQSTVVLRSKRLQKRVIPRLSSAHNYTHRSLGVYRFLSSVAQQGVNGSVRWRWGKLRSAPFLPRVSYGRSIVSPARWQVARGDILDCGKPEFAALQELRARRNMPRFVSLMEGEDGLPLDLLNPTAVGILTAALRRNGRIEVTEMLPRESTVAAADGTNLAHDLLIPLVRTAPAPATPSLAAPAPLSFPLGSQWLYFKIYAEWRALDHILIEVIDSALADSAVVRNWHFLRYADPDPHLRLRFLVAASGPRADLRDSMLQRLANLAESGVAWRTVMDTYQPEVRRYGGPWGIRLAEEIFTIDSRCARSIIVDSLERGDGPELRWRLGLVAADRMLADLGLTLPEKVKFARARLEAFRHEFRAGGSTLRKIGANFRRSRPMLEEWFRTCQERLDGNGPLRDAEAAGLEPILQRSDALSELLSAHTAESRQVIHQVLPSLLHMSVNRLIASEPRSEEWAMFETLERLYVSAQARKQALGGGPGAV